MKVVIAPCSRPSEGSLVRLSARGAIDGMSHRARLAREKAIEDEFRGVDLHLQSSVDQIVMARVFATASADLALTVENEAGCGGKCRLYYVEA